MCLGQRWRERAKGSLPPRQLGDLQQQVGASALRLCFPPAMSRRNEVALCHLLQYEGPSLPDQGPAGVTVSVELQS